MALTALEISNSTAVPGLEITQTGSDTALQITNENTSPGISISQTGAGRAISITNTSTAASIFVDPNAATSTSTSVGGAILLENTGNDGAGLIIYSNNGASATGRLMNIRADNTAFANAALHVDYDGTANAVEISNASTDSSSNALNVVSTNPNDTCLGVNGAETGKGTIKVVHTGTGSDTTASGLSIDLQGTGTASQGIFVDSTATGGTTGDLMKLRNETDLKVVVKADGAFGIKDGITAPSAATGMALIYVDAADDSLKVKFANGTTKTLATNP